MCVCASPKLVLINGALLSFVLATKHAHGLLFSDTRNLRRWDTVVDGRAVVPKTCTDYRDRRDEPQIIPYILSVFVVVLHGGGSLRFTLEC